MTREEAAKAIEAVIRRELNYADDYCRAGDAKKANDEVDDAVRKLKRIVTALRT